MEMTSLETFKVIVGLGATGLSCARYLARSGVPFAVMDTRVDPPNYAQLKSEMPEVSVTLGGLDQALLAEASEVILSPGLCPQEPLLQVCRDKGVPIVSDIELFARAAGAPICAITGSNAKSTVTSLVTEMARMAGIAVRLGGNIGPPALDLLRASEPALYVLELSSFQLETTYSLAPYVATILNISPDHMDRYPNLAAYVAVKQRIYQRARFMIWNRDDQATYPKVGTAGAQLVSFGFDEPGTDQFGIVQADSGLYLGFNQEALLSVHELLIKGRHNWMNALSALGIGYALALPMPAMLQALQTFPGLPHRCQWVGEQGGVSWYNDSKGTNVGASLAAISGLGESIRGKLILIAGGVGKGADFSELKAPVTEHVRTLILLGEDASILEKAMDSSVPIVYAQDMQEAVHIAKGQAVPGDAVLLSPACASFDMFNNYAHRGEVFMQATLELIKRA
jgi:UDP-N-acetylmuramoylalanine--D-glutamate ligase